MRRRPFFYSAGFGTLLILIMLLPSPPRGAALGADAQRQQELESLRSRISGLRDQIASKSGEKTALSTQLEQTEQQIGKLARRLRVLDGRLQRQRKHLNDLRNERTLQEQALESQRRVLARQARAAYAMGRQERLKILLNQQEPATLSRVLAYYDYLNKARLEKMRAIRTQMAALADTERKILAEDRQLEQLREEQANQLAAMRDTQERRTAVVAALTRELNDQSQQLDRLQLDERELERLLDGIEEALADIPVENPQQVAFAGLRGELPWPAKGRIAQRFGAPKLGSLRWDGVMISAPEGEEVRAVHHGRVAFADWLRGYGLLLIVDHGDGYMTLYGHNQSLFKEPGDWVDTNEPVALVGSSGGQQQSGVYFGIRYLGKPVDPIKWCRRASGNKVG